MYVLLQALFKKKRAKNPFGIVFGTCLRYRFAALSEAGRFLKKKRKVECRWFQPLDF